MVWSILVGEGERGESKEEGWWKSLGESLALARQVIVTYF